MMTGEDEARFLRSTQAKEKSASKRRRNVDMMIREHIRSMVVESDPPLDFDNMTIGEELHLLKLIRESSFGPLYAFNATYTVDGIEYTNEFEVDTRSMELTIQTCGDPECPCHEVAKRDFSDLTESYNMAPDYSEIPPDHLEVCPPVYNYTTPVSGAACELRIATVKDKYKLGSWTNSDDDQVLTKSIAVMCKSINGYTSFRDIVRELEKMSSFDRMCLRDEINRITPGVDTAVTITCPDTGYVFEEDVELDSNFFLPKRVISVPWFVSILRSIRETGQSVLSWAVPLQSDE